MIALRRSVVPLVIVLVILVALFYAVFPTRTFLDQNSAIAEARADLDALHEENDALRSRMKVLSTPEEIERLARSEYNLVYPGEEAFVILPSAPEPVQIPDLWPLNALVSSLAG
ncbi:MAG: septum formation initiator family protein [Acidimicrobiia bacterium]|nr:septum formation initiator family protein [Acidimicrobiia bacterium]MCY4434886.1 septum formation initiator family protein [bacterium]